MTPIPLTDCCTMLGIDPKTLRNWLKHAPMPFAVHPLDARRKCLMMEQVQQLALVHGRSLPASFTAIPALQEEAPPPGSCEEQVATGLAPDAVLLSVSQEADLTTRRLTFLETKVATLQEQLAQLALDLLHERHLHTEQRLSTLEVLVQPTADACSLPQALQQPSEASSFDAPPASERCLVPAELRARSRVTPLVEYGARGIYVAVCPKEGALSFAPDSAAWFDWLASLTSFRFVGSQGRFTAYRTSEHGQPTRGWTAHRFIHGSHYKHYLGVTDRLTISCLEQMAAKLQSHLPSF